jgi:hypothetical protein
MGSQKKLYILEADQKYILKFCIDIETSDTS